jgi:hypothetical protein
MHEIDQILQASNFKQLKIAQTHSNSTNQQLQTILKNYIKINQTHSHSTASLQITLNDSKSCSKNNKKTPQNHTNPNTTKIQTPQKSQQQQKRRFPASSSSSHLRRSTPPGLKQF